jgi:hypothetical protein
LRAKPCAATHWVRRGALYRGLVYLGYKIGHGAASEDAAPPPLSAVTGGEAAAPVQAPRRPAN